MPGALPQPLRRRHGHRLPSGAHGGPPRCRPCRFVVTRPRETPGVHVHLTRHHRRSGSSPDFDTGLSPSGESGVFASTRQVGEPPHEHLDLSEVGVFALVWPGWHPTTEGGAPVHQRVVAWCGVVLGGVLQVAFGPGAVVDGTVEWVGLVGGGYVRLLQMIVIPLVWCRSSRVTFWMTPGSWGRSVGRSWVSSCSQRQGSGDRDAVTRLFGLSARGWCRGPGSWNGVNRWPPGARLRRPERPRPPPLLHPTTHSTTHRRQPHLHHRRGGVRNPSGLPPWRLRRRTRNGAEGGGGDRHHPALVMRLVRMVIRLTPFGCWR